MFERTYQHLAQTATLATSVQDALIKSKKMHVKLEYVSQSHFAVLARQLHLMSDEKAGVPRTAYKGIVETRPHGTDKLLFLVPRNM